MSSHKNRVDQCNHAIITHHQSVSPSPRTRAEREGASPEAVAAHPRGDDMAEATVVPEDKAQVEPYSSSSGSGDGDDGGDYDDDYCA